MRAVSGCVGLNARRRCGNFRRVGREMRSRRGGCGRRHNRCAHFYAGKNGRTGVAIAKGAGAKYIAAIGLCGFGVVLVVILCSGGLWRGMHGAGGFGCIGIFNADFLGDFLCRCRCMGAMHRHGGHRCRHQAGYHHNRHAFAQKIHTCIISCFLFFMQTCGLWPDISI